MGSKSILSFCVPLLQTLNPSPLPRSIMTRGRKPTSAIEEAKKFAERMGYRWQENTHPDLGYDLFIFKEDAAAIVRVRQTRHQIHAEIFYEDFLKEELAEVRGLPFPPWIAREIWLRT